MFNLLWEIWTHKAWSTGICSLLQFLPGRLSSPWDELPYTLHTLLLEKFIMKCDNLSPLFSLGINWFVNLISTKELVIGSIRPLHRRNWEMKRSNRSSRQAAASSGCGRIDDPMYDLTIHATRVKVGVVVHVVVCPVVFEC